MFSIPYSRYIFEPLPWYSFLIVTGAALAVFLACREERRTALPKDTVIDLALWVLPFGIIGARLYYVIFSWSSFRNDLPSIFRIWEGGLAIYGGLIAGLAVLLVFCRIRRLPALRVCDIIVPGVALAQCLGRWGNYFNIEAYGLTVTDPAFCFFPFAVQVPTDGYAWHLATFFYESIWDFAVFLFLMLNRRKRLIRPGDVFFFYLFLYAAGRLVIEEFRLDSLYAGSSVRISQLLSVLVCTALLIRYLLLLRRNIKNKLPMLMLLILSMTASVLALAYALTGYLPFERVPGIVVLYLGSYALLMIVSLFFLVLPHSVREASHADNRT